MKVIGFSVKAVNAKNFCPVIVLSDWPGRLRVQEHCRAEG